MAFSTVQRATSYVGLARDAVRVRRSTNDQVRQKAEKHLIQRMGKLRGLPQKLGQMLSFSNATQADATENLYQELQEDAEPLPLAEVTPILEQAWGMPLEEVLVEIDPIGKAGSIGQVHQAATHDGRQIAIKVQYPGIKRAIRTDLKMLGWLSRPVGNLHRGFDMSGYRQTILNNLMAELDYRQEAQLHDAFRKAVRIPSILVPDVIPHLSTESVLVTNWLEGDRWDDVREHWLESEKKTLAQLLVASFLEGLFLGGTIQADWHPGNFRFRRDDGSIQIVCYDLGSMYQPSDTVRLALARLIQATSDGSEPPLPLFLKLGFSQEYLEPMAKKLPALCRTLFEPFCLDRPYQIADWNLAERVADILGDDRWNFRIAGPPNMAYLMRAFHGLVFYLRGLNANVSWSREFSKVTKRLASSMQSLAIHAPGVETVDFTSLAKHMKIRVTCAGKPKAIVTTAATSIEHLEDLLDEDLLDRIARRGIDLREVVAEARRRCYAPGSVFELQEGTKHIVVTLE